MNTQKVGVPTPGPWVADRTGIWYGDEEAQLIATARSAAHPFEESVANAQLIAAAPDLLAACKAALSCPLSDLDADIETQLLAAIKKAEGQ